MDIKRVILLETGKFIVVSRHRYEIMSERNDLINFFNQGTIKNRQLLKLNQASTSDSASLSSEPASSSSKAFTSASFLRLFCVRVGVGVGVAVGIYDDVGVGDGLGLNVCVGVGLGVGLAVGVFALRWHGIVVVECVS